MGLVRLLGFNILPCGCLAGNYREVLSGRELTYIEEKGSECTVFQHRRNHTVNRTRPVMPKRPLFATSR